MTYYATREFQFGETTYFKGDAVESVTERLKQLGLVEEIQLLEEVVSETKETKEEIKKVKEEILTEQSSDVTVEAVEKPSVKRTPQKRGSKS